MNILNSSIWHTQLFTLLQILPSFSFYLIFFFLETETGIWEPELNQQSFSAQDPTNCANQPRLPPSSYSPSRRRKHPLYTKCSLTFRHWIVTLIYKRHYYACFIENETERSDTFAHGHTTERSGVRIWIQVPLTLQLQTPIHHVATVAVHVTVNICILSHFHNSQFSQLLILRMYSSIP